MSGRPSAGARYGRGRLPLTLLCLVSWLLACSSPAQRLPGTPAKNDAIIQIECDVAEAELWVNERFIAHMRNLRRGIALSPGEHRLEFRHDGHHTHYELITVAAKERRTLTIDMAEILP